MRKNSEALALALAFALAAIGLGVGCATQTPQGSAAAAERAGAQPASTASTVSSVQSANALPLAAPAMPGKNVPAIKVNTVGYAVGWKKIAIFNVEPKNAVVKDEAGKVVYTFKPDDIESRGRDAASQDAVWQANFSALTRAGRYTIESDGAKSDAFAIGEKLYANTLLAAQKHYYFQRCRTPLKEPHAVWEGDKFTRDAACHVHEDVGWDFQDYPEKKRKWKVEAGWHDAGNYEMYVPSTAPTAQALLMAYEAHPELFKDGDLNIPESGNKIPDILDEARWGLRWILGMQEPLTGGFRAREAVYDWSENVPPQNERKPRWIAGVGSASTAKACAVLAVAARVYKKYDPAFAARAEKAARAAWDFLTMHLERILVDGKGSPQTLWDDTTQYKEVGARLIAAAEVWRSFRLPGTARVIDDLLKDPETSPEKLLSGAWPNLSRWGLMTLARDAQTPEAVRSEAKKRLLAAVDSVKVQIEETDGYRCASKPSDYYWGHNSNLMEKGHQLAFALKLDPTRVWIKEALRDQWHWLLGRNPNGYSMVTRIGKGPDRMYHVEWGKTPKPPPGYLLGGPNGANMSFLAPGAPAKALLWDNEKPLRSGLPPHSLWHEAQSDLWDAGFVPDNQWSSGWWAVTEPDIYYNANLVLVAAELQDI